MDSGMLPLAGLLAVACAVAMPAVPAAEPTPPQQADSRLKNFITRQGDKLMDGDKEFRLVGANMPGLMLPYDWTLYLPERLTLPTPWEQEDGFRTLDQMNLRVVRLWNLPNGKSLTTLEGHTDHVTGLVFGPDGKILASKSSDQTVRLWNLPDAMISASDRAGSRRS